MDLGVYDAHDPAAFFGYLETAMCHVTSLGFSQAEVRMKQRHRRLCWLAQQSQCQLWAQRFLQSLPSRLAVLRLECTDRSARVLPPGQSACDCVV